MTYRTDRMLEIETKLDALTKENAELRRRIDLRMKTHKVCPQCEHGEVVHVSQVLDRSEVRTTMAIIQPSVWSTKTEGEFELYMCRSCGFVEWYVKDPEKVGQHNKSKEFIKILRESAPE